MTGGAGMLIESIHPSRDERLARDLLAVQRAAYAVEARLIGDSRIPPLHEDLEDLRALPVSWFGAYLGTDLIGAAAWSESTDRVEIHRLVIRPDLHRQGVGSSLLRRTLECAGPRTTTVATGRDNQPAGALYTRFGFIAVGDQEVLEGLWIRLFERPGDPPGPRSIAHA